jgi:nitrogen fixation-related uncharacterized protein
MAFMWSIKTGQYEDDYGPSVRMLYDDLPLSEAPVNKPNHNQYPNQK